MNKKISTGAGIAIIVVIAVIVGIAVWAMKESQTQMVQNAQPSSTKSQTTSQNASQAQATAQTISKADETANWKTYTNQKYSFTLKYPSSVVFDSATICGGEGGGKEAANSCGGVDICVNEKCSALFARKIHVDTLSKNSNLSLDAFINKAIGNSDIKERAKTVIDGKDAITLKLKGGIDLGSVQEAIPEQTNFVFISLSPTKVAYARYEVESCFTVKDGSQFDSPCTPLDTSNYGKIVSTLKFSK